MIAPFLFLIACFFVSTATTQQCKFNPYVYNIAIGNVTGIVTSDGPVMVGANFFSVADEAVTRSYARLYRATDPIIWQQNIPVLDTPVGRIMVDTGSFNTGLPPFAKGGQLIANLRSAGISPDSIDVIFLTHGHPDHVAGLVTKNGMRAFKNARVYVSKLEHEFWTAEPFVNPKPEVALLDRVSEIYRRSVGPYERAGKLKLVGKKGRPLAGIRFIPYPGHTPGHSAVELKSKGERIVFVGDAWFSQPDQIRNPEWVRPVETDGLEGFKSRVRLMESLAESKDIVLAFHEDFPGLGRIVTTAESFDWIPARPQNLGPVRKRC